MRVCSLFSGIGGIDLGFMQAGFNVVWANEFDKDAATTYRSNFGSLNLSEKDIRNIDSTDIPDSMFLPQAFRASLFQLPESRKAFLIRAETCSLRLSALLK